ncbi:MAG TPA: hypothetical protein VJ343_01805 [archaeon]|nr:hypothetical protein [archaeon]
MVYYHPGRVLEIFYPKSKEVDSADSSVQALVETWDENVITYSVDPRIADDLKVGDVVLIDYNPTSEQPFRPKMVVTKILKGEKAKKTWGFYKDYYKKRPKARPDQMPSVSQPSYVG